MSQRTYESMTPKPVAFLGLGVMGYPMAGHLARAGHRVTVYNRTAARAKQWAADYGGTIATTPREAALGAELVFACVGNDDDLRAVTLGALTTDGPASAVGRDHSGAFAGMQPGALFVDHTTASAEVVGELSAIAAQCGLSFIDAPVSGGNLGAVNGALTVMCGGDEAAFNVMRPVALAFAKAVTLLGPSGAGQLTKMVNQIAIAGLLQGLCEAITFGERAGLDMTTVFGALNKGSAQSWQMDHRGPTMLAGNFDFGFAVDLMRKDLGLVLDEARRNGARLPVTALVDQFFADLQADGGGRLDFTSLIQRLR